MMRVIVVLLLLAVCSAQVMLPDRPFKLHGPPLKPPVPPKIYSLHVDTSIMHGYARTTVEYQMFNIDEDPMDVEFAHSVPPNAYVTDFKIIYGNGMRKLSELRLRKDKSKEYLNAIHGGLPSSNHKNSRHALNFGHSDYFGASTYVQPFENVTFFLIYEELLQSKFGMYEYQLELRPQEVVESLRVSVYIGDSRRILQTGAPAITKKMGNEGNTFATIQQTNQNLVSVFYAPTKWQQREHHSRGINGIFRVQYQTEALQIGEYKIGNGHFAYYFNPTIQSSLHKHMILVMDTSDSMKSAKMQVTAALEAMMSTIRPGDKYTVIEFGSTIKIWNGERFIDPDTEMTNVDDFAINLEEDGESVQFVTRRLSLAKQSNFQGAGVNTNLNLALDAALNIAQSSDSYNIPYIVLMTDGKVNVGERNFEKIIRTVRFLSKENVPIFTLAMGEKPEENFLAQLAADNFGFSTRISGNMEVYDQLKDFQKLMEPIVGSVTMDFRETAVHDSISSYSFRSHFRGSEKVVTGRLIEPKKGGEVLVYIGAKAYEQTTEYNENQHLRYQSDWFLERIWAYNTIRDTIKKIASRESLTEIHAAQRKAGDLSLKYKFASELTSLIVRTVGHAPDIQNEIPVNLNGVSWSDEGPEKEHPDAAKFGFLGGLTLSFIPQITPFHTLVEDDLRKKFDWPVQIGIDGTAILQNGNSLKLGFGKVKLPYGDACVTGGGQRGICRLVHFCDTEEYTTDFVLYARNRCNYLDTNIYDGVCCPDQFSKKTKQTREDAEGLLLDLFTTTDEPAIKTTGSTMDLGTTGTDTGTDTGTKTSGLNMDSITTTTTTTEAVKETRPGLDMDSITTTTTTEAAKETRSGLDMDFITTTGSAKETTGFNMDSEKSTTGIPTETAGFDMDSSKSKTEAPEAQTEEYTRSWF